MGICKVKPAVFLDRDGVINQLVWNPTTREYESPHDVRDMKLQPGALQALRDLQQQGWELILISNQPSYAKGKTTLEEIKAIQAKLHAWLTEAGIRFRAYYYCYHHPQGIVPDYSGACECRKPNPYFVHKAVAEHCLDAKNSWLVGDQDSDILCGQNAGLRTILLTETRSRKKRGQSRPDYTAANLAAAAAILSKYQEARTGEHMKAKAKLKIKIFADGANIGEMKKAYAEGVVKGFTTNPTLMRKAGVSDYEKFAAEVLREIRDLPISFEVFADDLATMEKEARQIASWGKNVNIKIPITNTQGLSTVPLIKKLSAEGLCINVTAMLTLPQVREVARALHKKTPAIVSVFAGRIADTGRDPMPLMRKAAEILKAKPKAELLWASSRELLNVFQAQSCGCRIITVTPDILKKMALIGMDLQELSLDTVKMFQRDASAAGYTLL
ncbi:transaldolase [candidate division FCPU426 bacterium]|nr:transaldolase [candidate division FCPU426 bacterium]